MFDPTGDLPDQFEGNPHDNNLPPGEYICVGTFGMLKSSKAEGKPYASVRMTVIGATRPETVGAAFWTPFFLDLTKDGNRGRLGWHCRASGHGKPFDPTDPNELFAALLHRPFKCQVKRSTYRGEPQNEIARYVLPSEWSEAEKACRAEWLKSHGDEPRRFKDERESGRANRGDFDDGFGGSAGDDDIPF